MFHFRLLCDLCVYPFQAPVETKFDDLFGTSAAIDPFNFNSQNGMRKDDKWVSLQEQSDMNKHLLDIKLPKRCVNMSLVPEWYRVNLVLQFYVEQQRWQILPSISNSPGHTCAIVPQIAKVLLMLTTIL